MGRHKTHMPSHLFGVTGVTTDFLLGVPPNYGAMPNNIKNLAEIMAALSPSDQAVLEKVIAAMADRSDEKKTIPSPQNG